MYAFTVESIHPVRKQEEGEVGNWIPVDWQLKSLLLGAPILSGWHCSDKLLVLTKFPLQGVRAHPPEHGEELREGAMVKRKGTA